MILNASGCLDALAAPDVARALDAFVTKTVTPSRARATEPVRIAETDVGMLNSIGLANPGDRRLPRRRAAAAARARAAVWVSVGGFAAEDYADLCARLDEPGGGARAEPLLPERRGARGRGAREIVDGGARRRPEAALREALARPARTSPAVAAAAADAGADGLSLVNTIRGLALDAGHAAAPPGTGSGGLSGPALRPVALAAVHACYRATGLPIVGHGRRRDRRVHALELIAAGASAVALGTVLFADPGAPARVRRELAAEAAARGFDDPLAARGVRARRSIRTPCC